jgi:polysaccharide biosynthesis transport protein
VELTRFVHLLRRQWVIIVACVLAGAAVGVLLPMTMTPVYDARAQSFITLADTAGSPDASLYSSSQFTMSRLKSYTLLVGSSEVLEPAIDDLDLDVSVSELRNRVTASSPTGSFIVSVTATAGSPDEAAAVANAVSVRLGDMIESLEETTAGTQVRSTLVRTAEPPAAPSSPRPKLALALGLLVGLAAGLGLAAARQQLDRSVRTSDQLKALAGAGVLAEIPADSSVAADTLSGAVTEAFRKLRASLRFVDVDHPPRVVTVSSAVSAEGKTSTAVNLAVSFAASGRSVCLVDADLRRPAVSARIGILDSIGLSDLLIGEHTLEDVLVTWRPRVTVLPAGTLPPDPVALLSSHAMEALLADLRGRFDVVVIDSPPLKPVVDGAVLGAIADGTILVVRYGSTDAPSVQRSVEVLADADARLLGTVLNRVPRSRRRRHGDYAYVPRTTRSPHQGAHAAPARPADAAEHPVAVDPAAVDPTAGDPTAGEPEAVDALTDDEQVAGARSPDDRVIDDPVTEEPVTEDQVTDVQVTDVQATDDQAADDQGTDDQGTDDQGTDAPAGDEQGTDERGPGDGAAEASPGAGAIAPDAAASTSGGGQGKARGAKKGSSDRVVPAPRDEPVEVKH